MNEYSDGVIETVNKINIVKYVSQYVDLEKKGELYIGVCPFHNEDTPSFTIYPYNNSWYCFGCNKGASIIDFVRYKNKCSFTHAVKILLDYSHIDPQNIHSRPAILSFLKRYQKQVEKNVPVNHIILPNNVMEQYEKTPIFEWISEGINQETTDKYQVRYNPEDNSIVFPVQDNNGNIIAVKRRTCYSNYKELGISKYIYYQPLGQNDFLFGLYFHKDNIVKQNECICVEGEKSVMKLESYGINNSVAICTHNINAPQINTLLSLKTDIVIAFDKDVSFDEVKDNCKKLLPFTNVYVMIDRSNQLSEKDSPCDKGIDVWNKLYSERVKL